MRTTLIIAAAGLAALAGVASADSHAPRYSAGDLLSPCQEADNDSRWGDAAETECEQYIMGFVDALDVMGASACPPAQNTADEVRWAFMRWVHEDFSARKSLEAGPALMSALKDKFACS